MNEQEKLIEEQLKTLPASLQQAINTVPWKTLVQEIGKENTLDSEQTVSLEQETMFVLYAFENPNDFVQNIVKGVGVSQETAVKIANSVADKILGPILDKSTEQEKTISNNLPMVEEGEVAHSVPHVEESKPIEPTKASLPDYRYSEGKDPYREPLV